MASVREEWSRESAAILGRARAGVMDAHLAADVFLEYARADNRNVYLTAGISASFPGKGLDAAAGRELPVWLGGFVKAAIKYGRGSVVARSRFARRALSAGTVRMGLTLIHAWGADSEEAPRMLRSMTFLLLTAAGVSGWAGSTIAAPAETAGPASAEDSDPRALGWMQGFPPPPEKLIGQPDSNYFSFPKLRWTVCHLRELLPTEQVSRGLGAPVPLERAPDDGIGAVTFTPLGSDEPMTWGESLAANYTDGILILHEGRIVYERYFGCLDEAGQHAAMSMTKSMTGLLAEILVAEGTLDDAVLVASIIPELKGSAFGGATVRQVMDMTTALDYSEDYADPKADIWAYSAAASPLPKPAGYTGPDGYVEYLQTVRPAGEHGQAFAYKTVNTDVLGWIVSRASGMEITELLSARIWSRMGAEQDAYMTVDGKGTPFAGGGLSAGLRDLGRIGLLMLHEGVIHGERLFPAKVVADIRAGGDKRKFVKAGFDTLEGGSYRGMWWILHNAHGAYASRGVHGQTIYIDPTADMVIVRLASFPVAKNSRIDPTSLPAYQAVAEYLVDRRTSTALTGRWRIETIRESGSFDKAATEVVFMDGGRVAMTVGCNRLSTSARIRSNRMRFSEVAGTKMACEPALSELEGRLLLRLEGTRSFRVSGGGAGLELLSAEGATLIVLSRRAD